MPDRILMIEDDESLSAMLAEYLAGLGFAVAARASAASGLEALREGGFDALILDVMLPDSDGFEVCRRVRAESDLPILMLTARGDETDRIVGLELGADDYLPNRSTRASWRRACAPSCAGALAAPRAARPCASAGWRSIRMHMPCGSTVPSARSRAISSICCGPSPATPAG